MLPISKPGATNLNVWTGSRIQKLEVLSKMPKIVQIVVKLTTIRKTRVKSHRGQTWSGFAKLVVVVYFAYFWLNKKSWSLSQKNGLQPYFYFRFDLCRPGDSPFCRILARIADRWLEMLPIRKTGATNLNRWTGSRSRKPEVLSKMPEMVRNAVE